MGEISAGASAPFRDRLVAAIRGRIVGPVVPGFAETWADALIAAGVVADPATLGHAYDKIAELSRKGDEAVRERDRYRAALHDIAALHYETDIKTGPGETYRGCDDDWEPWPCATHAVLARHGIDAEEPQP